MDNESIQLASQSIEAISATARDFLRKLLGPAAEEAGLILGDRIKYYRLKNIVKILEKSKNFLEEQGLSPHAVNLKALYPILEYASLEEDESLQDKWAALLANAANSKMGVNPSFPEILKQLSPAEVKMLDAVCDHFCQEFKRVGLSGTEALGGEVSQFVPPLSFDSLGLFYSDLGLATIAWPMTLGDFKTHAEMAYTLRAEVKSLLQNLTRLGLLSRERDVEFDKYKYEKDFAQLPKSVRYTVGFTLSAFGYEFVTVCRRPKSILKSE